MYLRLLSIRKHKTVTFLNAYSDEFGVTQYMIKNELLKNIKCGDLINVDFIDTINARGNKIKEITNVKFIVPSYGFESYKGINSEITDAKYKDYLEARNCGMQLKIIQFKQELLKKIKTTLDNLNLFDATTLLNNVEHYKNGSNIIDAEILDREESQPRFLRVTLENQLKQMVGMLLKSCYAIDKVYRNMGEDSGHINEFLMLEFVSLNLSLDEIIDLVIKLDKIAYELAQDYGLVDGETKSIEIIDYNDLKKNNNDFKTMIKELNILIVNYPCNSPFIKNNEENYSQTETRWYMNGHWISHFYEDENNYEDIKSALQLQKEENLKPDSNPLDYFMWGLPNTTSFGLSVDRWLQFLLKKENISSIANPIQLDYMKRELKK